MAALPSASIGPETGGVHLVLDARSATPGTVVSAVVLGDPQALTSRIVEITCGAKDTRVSHPVVGGA